MKMSNTAIRHRSLAALVLAFAFLLACLAGCAANGQNGQSSSSSSQSPQQSISTSAAKSVEGEIIGIIGAMDAEVDLLKSEAGAQNTITIAGMGFYEGALDGKPVVIVKCGMGKVNAGICAHTLINYFGCTKVINTGVAGSLDNRLNIGDIVVSTDAVQHDFDVSAIGFEKGEIPYTGLYAFPADEKLREAAMSAAREAGPYIQVLEGRVCSGDQFISTKEQRDEITSSFGGLCCEMEGAAIAQTCYLNDVPFVVIRAISDKPDETQVEEYHEFESKAAMLCAALVEYMVEFI